MEDRKRIKEPKIKLKELFREYCSKSTIHGVQYVGDPKRPLPEKLYWIVIFIICSSLNFYLIWQVWNKWQESPVIVSFSDMSTPVWKIPFPAITVCSRANARRQEFNFKDLLTAQMNNLTNEIDEKLSAMSVVCRYDTFAEGNDYLSKELIDFLSNIAPSLEETFTGCKMAQEYIDCQDIFRPVFTEDGLCFTSNVLNHSEIFREPWSVELYPKDLPKSQYWTLENGFEKGSPLETYPKRGLTSGDKSGLLIVINGNRSNHDPLCRGPIPAFKLMLHNPAEIPSTNSKFIRIPHDEEISIWVKPNIMTTSDNLRDYSPEKRQCFYPNERCLKYFKIYTERNCELECLTNYTMSKCGCVAIYMPRDENTAVCGGGMKTCVNEASENIREEEIEINDTIYLSDNTCNCLPSCTSIKYQAETSQINFNWLATLNAIGDDVSQYGDVFMSRVSVFFTESHFSTSHRSELFGIIDFLANVGGLLGLFSGISFLSFLEIIYFATLRPWTNFQREKNKNSRKISPTEDHSPSINLEVIK